ncbi:MAG: 2-oxoacid:acceptor oxidoreductase family protein [Synergistales bacterium]|jgi:indolepyruvate ferredoxin oxidoreductase beta subunit
MQFIIAGVGGQGILFASRVLGHIALSKGLPVNGSEVHGMSQRGGSVISHFKIGPYASPLVRAGEADILLAFEQGEGLRNFHFLKKGAVALVNADRPDALSDPDLVAFLQARAIRLHPIAGYDLLREKMGGRFLFLNALVLGALAAAGATGFPAHDLRGAVESLAPARFRDDNLKAFDLGFGALGAKS